MSRTGHSRVVAGAIVLLSVALLVYSSNSVWHSRGTELHTPHRPQEPTPPFPYESTDVTYEGTEAGIRLAGTLTRPRSGVSVAGLLLVTGSGAQDRDESAAGHKFFLVLADYLTRRGFAVLRVDDRGIGGSTGSTSLATTMDFVGDAIAGVEFLKLTDGIDPLRIGLIGHSEGGLIASLAAKRSSDVAFIVMMGAIGMPGAQAVELQHEVFGKAAGHSPSRIAFDVAMEKAMFAILRATPDDAKAIEQMNALWEQRKASLAHAALTLEEQRLILASDAAIKQRIKALPTPWNRYFLSYDPTEALQQVHCPILVVSGSLDLQAPPRAHFPAIRSALASAENRDVTLLEIPGVNHAMQTAITGLPSEYATIQETFSPVVLSAIGDWVKAHAALEGQPPR